MSNSDRFIGGSACNPATTPANNYSQHISQQTLGKATAATLPVFSDAGRQVSANDYTPKAGQR